MTIHQLSVSGPLAERSAFYDYSYWVPIRVPLEFGAPIVKKDIACHVDHPKRRQVDIAVHASEERMSVDVPVIDLRIELLHFRGELPPMTIATGGALASYFNEHIQEAIANILGVEPNCVRYVAGPLADRA